MKYRNFLVACFLWTLLAGCATNEIYQVRQSDLDAWVGEPVLSLEIHPIFLTIPVVKTKASDGTEIWNYVNGVNFSECTGGGSIFGKNIDYSTYNQFTNCMSKIAACNNIFFIKDGKVLRYNPIGTGGMRCYTIEQLRPGFNGNINFR